MGKTGVGAGPKNVTWYAEHAKLHKFGVGRGGLKNVCCPQGACPTYISRLNPRKTMSWTHAGVVQHICLTPPLPLEKCKLHVFRSGGGDVIA